MGLFKDYNDAKQIHHKALRMFLGVHRNASLVVINGDMGWLVPVVRRHLNIVRLWHRLKSLNNDRLIAHIFRWDKTSTGKTWYSELKWILSESDLSDILVADRLPSLRSIIQNVQSALMTKYVEQ